MGTCAKLRSIEAAVNTVAAFTLAWFMIAPRVAADDYAVPRTSFGDPDLQGVWTNSTVTPVERPDWITKPTITAAEARAWEKRAAEFGEQGSSPTDPQAGAPEAGDDVGGYNSFWIDAGTKVAEVRGEFRTSLVVDPADGRIPYKPDARARLFALLRNISVGLDGPEQRPLGERCIVGFGSTGGPPMLPVLYNNHYQIVQSPGHVMILVEMNHDARIIRIGGQHPEPGVRPWLGDSIAHWDGDTLVVETTNMNPGQSLRECIRHRVYMSPDVKVTERFTRVAGDEILYEFTVDDPSAFTQVWRGEIPFRTAKGPIYEYACHEGNYALPGILAGARQQERGEGSTKVEGGGR